MKRHRGDRRGHTEGDVDVRGLGTGPGAPWAALPSPFKTVLSASVSSTLSTGSTP